MAPELWILGTVFAAIVLVAVPTIVRGSLLPAELALETVPDSALTDAQRRYFQRLDTRLAPLGYAPIANYVATNLQGANLTRYYRSEVDPAVLGASCLRGLNLLDERSGDRNALNYCEWITKYEDGTALHTLNSTMSDVFEPMPHQIKRRWPGLSDVARLKEQHDRAAAALLTRQPRFPRGRDVVEEWKEHHRRFCAFQESRGALRHDEAASGYRLTHRVAWRGVANFLNPLADNFSVPRFAVGVVAGVGLPSAALWALRDASLLASLVEAVPLSPALLALVLAFVAFALAGAVVGWVFEAKSFVWCLLLGYVPLRVAHSSFGLGLALLLWMGFVADRASWLRTRLKAVV